MSLFGSSLFTGGVAAAGAGGASTFPVVNFTGIALNLVVADNLKFFVMNSLFPQTVTIPENASESFPISAEIEFIREGAGAGTVTFVIAGAAVLQSRDGLVEINSRYSAVTLKKIAVDEWRLFGDLA